MINAQLNMTVGELEMSSGYCSDHGPRRNKTGGRRGRAFWPDGKEFVKISGLKLRDCRLIITSYSVFKNPTRYSLNQIIAI